MVRVSLFDAGCSGAKRRTRTARPCDRAKANLRFTTVQADDLKALQAKVKKAVNIDYAISHEDLGGQDPGEAMAALMFENHGKSQNMLGVGTYQILNSAQKRRLRRYPFNWRGSWLSRVPRSRMH